MSFVLAIATLLLGGGNIWQLVNNRQLKRKLNAEGEQAEIQSLKLIIEGNVTEIKRLQQRYEELWDKYIKLQDELDELKQSK